VSVLEQTEPWFELTLFVSGASELSARAIANATELCDVHLEGRCRLSVVDLRDDAATAAEHDVLAAPTLLRRLPLPARRVVGDLSDREKVLRTLDLPGLDAHTARG
jgi:circadian clock protein KaiB